MAVDTAHVVGAALPALTPQARAALRAFLRWVERAGVRRRAVIDAALVVRFVRESSPQVASGELASQVAADAVRAVGVALELLDASVCAGDRSVVSDAVVRAALRDLRPAVHAGSLVRAERAAARVAARVRMVEPGEGSAERQVRRARAVPSRTPDAPPGLPARAWSVVGSRPQGSKLRQVLLQVQQVSGSDELVWPVTLPVLLAWLDSVADRYVRGSLVQMLRVLSRALVADGHEDVCASPSVRAVVAATWRVRPEPRVGTVVPEHVMEVGLALDRASEFTVARRLMVVGRLLGVAEEDLDRWREDADVPVAASRSAEGPVADWLLLEGAACRTALAAAGWSGSLPERDDVQWVDLLVRAGYERGAVDALIGRGRVGAELAWDLLQACDVSYQLRTRNMALVPLAEAGFARPVEARTSHTAQLNLPRGSKGRAEWSMIRAKVKALVQDGYGLAHEPSTDGWGRPGGGHSARCRMCALLDYLRLRDRLGVTSVWLFPGGRAPWRGLAAELPMSEDQLRYAYGRVGALLDVELTPKSARKTAVTGYVSQPGADIREAQRLAGHQRLPNTDRYDLRPDAAEVLVEHDCAAVVPVRVTQLGARLAG